MNRTLILLRGASGAGKSSFAQLFGYPSLVCTADDYFYDEQGNYNFDASKLGAAHAQCRATFDEACKYPDIVNIIIANTNTKPSDYSYYEDKAKKLGFRVFHVILENRHGNIDVHGVPESVRQEQASRILANIKLI